MHKRSFLSFIMLVSSIFSASLLSKNGSSVLEKVYADSPFETILSNDELGVTLTESTTTDLTQYFTFSFSTNKTIYASSRYSTCKLIITDPSFDGVIEDHSDDKNYPEYDAAICQISGSADIDSPYDVILPKSAICSNAFRLNIKSIYPSSIVTSNIYINRIVIPESIENIPANAFDGVWENTEFYYVSKTEKVGWESGWNQGHDIANHNSFQYESAAQRKEAIDPSYSIPQTSNNGYQFIIGAYDQTKTNYWQPLRLNYDVNTNGSISHKTQEFLPSSSTLIDRVGAAAGGEEIVKLNITIDKSSNEIIDIDTLTISNIFRFSGDITNPIDFNSGICKANVINITENKSLDEFINFSAVRFVRYGGYTQFSVTVIEVDGIYEKINPDVYNDVINELESGVCFIRYRFTSIYESSLRITYKNNKGETKTAVSKIVSPFSFFNLEKKADNVGFLLKNSDVASDFDGHNILNIQFENFYVCLDIYSNHTHNVVNAQATVYTKFGKATLYNEEPIDTIELNVIFIVIISVSLSLYLIISIALFFIYKRIFRNDEFRRLKPKQFIKKAIIYFIGYAFIVLSATFIVFRWGFLYSTIVVFNPLDALVIITTLGGGISLGLFIKDFVVAIKTTKKRKENMKLHIDSADINDGTK